MAVGQPNLEAFGQAELLYEASHEVAQSDLAGVAQQEAVTPQEGFAYTRADGTIERARTAEEAIKACPVLGRLALMDPTSAQMLLEISSIGTAKMSNATKEAPPKESKIIEQSPKIPFKHEKIGEVTSKSPQTEKPIVVTESHTLRAEIAGIAEKSNLRREQSTQANSRTFLEQSLQALRRADAMSTAEQAHSEQVQQKQSNPLVRQAEVAATAPQLKKVQVKHLADHGTKPLERPVETESHSEALEQEAVPLRVIELGENSFDKVREISEAPTQTDEAPIESDAEQHDAIASLTETELPHLAGELVQGGDEVCENFTEALSNLMTLPEVTVETIDEISEAEIPQTYMGEQVGEGVVPVIVTAVAEKLTHLGREEKIVIAPILQEVMDLRITMQQLKTQDTDKQAIDVQEKRLVEAVTALFEAAGIAYEEDEPQLFIEAILRPEFQPDQPISVTDIDLEYTGTHEAKYHFPKITVALVALEDRLRQALGTAALLSI